MTYRGGPLSPLRVTRRRTASTELAQRGRAHEKSRAGRLIPARRAGYLKRQADLDAVGLRVSCPAHEESRTGSGRPARLLWSTGELMGPTIVPGIARIMPAGSKKPRRSGVRPAMLTTVCLFIPASCYLLAARRSRRRSGVDAMKGSLAEIIDRLEELRAKAEELGKGAREVCRAHRPS